MQVRVLSPHLSISPFLSLSLTQSFTHKRTYTRARTPNSLSLSLSLSLFLSFSLCFSPVRVVDVLRNASDAALHMHELQPHVSHTLSLTHTHKHTQYILRILKLTTHILTFTTQHILMLKLLTHTLEHTHTSKHTHIPPSSIGDGGQVLTPCYAIPHILCPPRQEM